MKSICCGRDELGLMKFTVHKNMAIMLKILGRRLVTKGPDGPLVFFDLYWHASQKPWCWLASV
jgi:hypothetical protein